MTRDRGRGHGAVGHQGQGRRAARVPAAGRRVAARASRCTATPTATTSRRRARGGRALRRAGLPGGARADAACRGCATTYGVGHGPDVLRAGRRGACRRRTSGRTEKYLRARAGACSRAVREEFGPELQLLHDVHHRLTPIEAARLGKEPGAVRADLDGGPGSGRAPGGLPADPPAHHDADRGRRGVQHHLGLPPADPGAAHRLHPRHGRARRRDHATCAASSTWPSCTTCAAARHGATDLSPVCMAAALHLDLSIPNFGLQEYMRHTAGDRRACSRTRTASRTATCIRARRRASASTSTRSWPRSYPYSAASLPVNRLEDGTVHDW